MTYKTNIGWARTRPNLVHALAVLCGLSVLASACFADRIEMVNGDNYSGSVLSVNLTNVTFRSEVQGTITLPRTNVARITFRESAGGMAPRQEQAPMSLQTPRMTTSLDLAEQLRPKGADTNLIARIQSDLLSQAGPEATRKYNELARGLLSGSFSVADLRKQAQQTLKEAEGMKEDLGPDASELLDGYLEILRRFLNEPESSAPNP